MKKINILGIAILSSVLQAQAAFISNHDNFTDGGVIGVDLDTANDWWIHGADASTETYSKKIGSGITLTAQGGGAVLAQDRMEHTYVWANGTSTLDNPSSPAAHDPNSYRRREYTGGLLNGAPTLDLSKGAYFSVDMTAGNTVTNTVTVYGLARRNNEIYVEAFLTDSTKSVTNAVLSPTLLATQTDGDATTDSSFSFSFAFQADHASDILSFTIIGYNDASVTDCSMAIGAVTVSGFVPPPPPTYLLNNADFSATTKIDVNLDEMDDWWIHGSNEVTDVFSQKLGSGIVLTAQGGGETNYGDRIAHTYVWSNSTATADNPSAPAAYNTEDYRWRQYPIGLLGGAPTLDLTKGAFYSVDVMAGNTQTNRLTVYGMGRRNDEIYVEAFLQDSTKTVTNATLAPALLSTQPDSQTTDDISFSFSLDFQAASSNDVLSFTIAGYNDADTTDRSLAIDAVTVQDVASIPAPIPNTNIPNVIIIFTDDHGFTDLGIQGIDSNVQTPMLDSLAAGGALMRHGYATAPQCVPSRAGIMSGRIQNTFGTRQNGSIWGKNPLPLNIPTIAERITALGTYKTGMIGKWHLNPHGDAVPGVDYPGTSGDYDPEDRGFQEYWRNSTSPYVANYDLAGNTLSPAQSITDSRNRVIVQGEAAEAFIERNVDQPFFLYLSLFGPHLPRMSTSDPYYLNFPVLDYPQYNAEMDDIRRLGLGLVRAIDDSVAGVMQKLRDLGIEENTLILFSGDNGAQPKFFNGIGNGATISKWTGNENIPLRGEKGSLWEGGIKVPMLAYWKGTIASNQVIDAPIWTLDFTATALKLAGGTIPPEFDGVDILPYLTGETNVLERSQPMFWDWGNEIAMRKGEWKFIRKGSRKNLFNLARDPMELYDVKGAYPEKFAAMEAEMMAWYNALPPEGQAPLTGDGIDFYVTGDVNNPADPRYMPTFSDGTPVAYPAPLQYGVPVYNTDGDAVTDWEELISGSDPLNSNDVFRIQEGAAGTNGSYSIELEGKSGRSYTLWQSDNLVSNVWNPVDVVGPVSVDAPVSLMDTNGAPSSYYRLEVSE